MAGTVRLVRIAAKMNRAKYKEILDENLFQSTKDLRMGRRFTFQQDNDPKHTAKTNTGVYRKTHVKAKLQRRNFLMQVKPFKSKKNPGLDVIPVEVYQTFFIYSKDHY